MCETIKLPVVLFWCESWSAIVGKEHRLRVFENGVVRREEVTGYRRQWHSEQLHELYCSPLFRGDGRGMWHVWGRREIH